MNAEFAENAKKSIIYNSAELCELCVSALEKNYIVEEPYCVCGYLIIAIYMDDITIFHKG